MLANTKTQHGPQAAVATRYGTEKCPSPGPWSDAIALMLKHRSVRAFLDRPLPENTLETLAVAGQSASTSSNMQSWSVVAVTDPARKKRLADASQNQKFIEECPLFLCFVADLSRAARIEERHGLNLSALPLLDIFLTATTDCALAAQNIVIAAQSIGLSCCFVGALRNDTELVARELELPAGSFAIFGLCIGYENPEKQTQVKPRLPQQAVFHRETYKLDGEQEVLGAYDEIFSSFGSAYTRSKKTWAQRVNDRLANPDYLNGRENLREALERRGMRME
jgi:nitroreductase